MAKAKGGKLRFPGLNARIKERLRKTGYWRADNRPDVGRFCEERGYLTAVVYDWISKNATPSWENLSRLEADLGTTKAWLLLGVGPEESSVASRRRKSS